MNPRSANPCVMHPRLARLLVRLYPRAWRERYGAEFLALLEGGHGGVRASARASARTAVRTTVRAAANVVWAALGERVFPTVGGNMEQSRFQSWCIRAPWAMFSFGPVLFLAAAYALACLILWSGWKVFLPGADTPFIPVDGPAIIYFQAGRLLYFSAPVLIGWGIALIAGRLRVNAVWPTVGWILIALIGGTVQVHTSRPALPGAAGHVSIGFNLGASSVQAIPDGLLHALVYLSLTVLPYVVWRLLNSRRTLSA
jgi:hypothetical protein